MLIYCSNLPSQFPQPHFANVANVNLQSSSASPSFLQTQWHQHQETAMKTVRNSVTLSRQDLNSDAHTPTHNQYTHDLHVTKTSLFKIVFPRACDILVKVCWLCWFYGRSPCAGWDERLFMGKIYNRICVAKQLMAWGHYMSVLRRKCEKEMLCIMYK